MVNQSKINDQRSWITWYNSGAIGTVEDAVKEAKKRPHRENYRNQLTALGNLDYLEVKELVRFEFDKGPKSVDQQVRRYYLKLKSDKPSAAANMLSELTPILSRGINDVSDVERLCDTMYKYWSGFLIRYEGKSYTKSNGRFKWCDFY